MRRYVGLLAAASVVLPSGLEAQHEQTSSRSGGSEFGSNRSTFASGWIPIEDKAPPGHQKWPSDLWEMAGWHIAIPLRRNHTRHWEGSANTLALRERRLRCEAGMRKVMGLPTGRWPGYRTAVELSLKLPLRDKRWRETSCPHIPAP
jgi:hypothetical protein